MTRCQGNTTACTGRDLLPVRISLRHDVFLFCAGCREAAANMGLLIVERRQQAVPVAQDRRGFRPRWLDRIAARDETGRLVA